MNSGLLRSRGATRKRVPNVEVDGAVAGMVQRAQGDIPGVPSQELVLAHHVDGAVLRILPNGLVDAERILPLDVVIAVRRTQEAVTNLGGAVGVKRHVLADPETAEIGVQQGLLRHGGFNAIHGAESVNRADAAVGAYDQVGSLAEDVAAAAIAQEIVGDEADILEDFEIPVD